MLLLLSLSALAQDSSLFLGGGLAVRPAWEPAAGFMLGAEAEADLRANVDIVRFRLDLDVNVGLVPSFGVAEVLPDVPVINTVRPEWAMVAAGTETWDARGGIINAPFGLEDWDDWALYLPTHGQYFDATPGRMLGGEFAYTLDSGLALGIGGGLDLDWDSPIVEVSANYEADSWGTYSGIALYPAMADESGGTHMVAAAVLGAEAYPSEVLTLALGGQAGVADGEPFALASVYGVFLPEAMVNPTVRVEYSFDPSGYYGAAPWAVSAGGAIVPTEYLKFLLEAKVTGTAAEPSPGVYASLCIFRPEPE